MNNDLISREALKTAIEDHFDELDAYFPSAFIKEIDNAPTVDAIVNTIEVRPQGEWYYSIDKGWECNQCHEIVKDMPTCMRKALYNFCPNCGADMRGGAE